MVNADVPVPLTRIAAEERPIVRDLFEEAFEPHEREPFEDLIEREEAGEARTLVMRHASGPVALATTSPLSIGGWTYLEYFAVGAALRGRGVGRRLWRTLLSRLPESAPRLVLEIHDPSSEPAGSPEHEIRERRRRFYADGGAVELPVRGYVMPELEDDSAYHPGLLLAWLPDHRMPGAGELASLVECLHRESYELPAGHRLTLEILRGLRPAGRD